jgi:hypothetical protein
MGKRGSAFKSEHEHEQLQELAELVQRNHDHGDTLSRPTVELALRITGRYRAIARERLVWHVSCPPDPGWEREDEWR